MDGQQIRAARERAGLTQGQLGVMVGVGLRTVGNWERGETVPRNRMAKIREVLAPHLEDGSRSTDPLATASDVALLAELARRLDRVKGTGEPDEQSAPIGVRTAKVPGGRSVKAGATSLSKAAAKARPPRT